MWDRRENCTRFLWGSPKERDPLGRLRHRWEVGIRMDLREIGWDGVEWIHLAVDRDCWQAFVKMVMNVWFLSAWS
jgi:hypothetical protein